MCWKYVHIFFFFFLLSYGSGDKGKYSNIIWLLASLVWQFAEVCVTILMFMLKFKNYVSSVKQIASQVGCMWQVFRAGALGRPRGMGWEGRREGGSGWGTHVNPWLIHVNIWQKPLQYCKVISLQLIKINEKLIYICTYIYFLTSIWFS